MQEKVIFRDDQEVPASDLNNVQTYARSSIDRVVKEGISDAKHYTGFTATKKSATVLTVQPGAFWSAGKVYIYTEAQDIDVFNHLAVATKRKVLVGVYGVEQEVDVEPRDFMINAETNTTEPQAVAMRQVRAAVVDTIGGAESADPQTPGTPSTHIGFALVTMDTEQILSVEMLTANLLPAVYRNHQRLIELERWRALIDPQISTIASDVAAIKEDLRHTAKSTEIATLAFDVAILKEVANEPDDYVNWGADRFLDDDESDTEHGSYNARSAEGIRFPWAAQSTKALKLANPTDPLVKTVNGLTLPKWTEVSRLSLTAYAGERSVSQYQTQTTSVIQLTRTRRRIRWGETKTVCTNSRWWKSGAYDPEKGIFQYEGETYTVENQPGERVERMGLTHWVRVTRFWEDTYQEAYWDRVTTTNDLAGAVVAQSFLNAQEGWLTSVDLKFTRVDSANDVEVLIAETMLGAPNMDRVIARTTLAGANAKQYVPETGSGLTNVPLTPTFLDAGKRYCVVLITGGEYYVALTQEANSIHGTFFYSTDGVFFMGDAANDMMLNLNFARFDSNRVEVTLGWGTANALELVGGIMDIDILAETVMPASTRLDYQVRPVATWITMEASPTAVLASGPNLLPLRAVFNGTRDVMPAIRLDTSQCEVSRPGTAFTHISTERTLGSACDVVTVAVDLEGFDDTPHDCTISILVTGGGEEAADVVADKVITDGLRRTATFNVTAITGYKVKVVGTTNSAASTFHVAQRVDYAVEA